MTDVIVTTTPPHVVVEVVPSARGLRGLTGEPGPAQVWVGPTPPDPNVYPLWLKTS